MSEVMVDRYSLNGIENQIDTISNELGQMHAQVRMVQSSVDSTHRDVESLTSTFNNFMTEYSKRMNVVEAQNTLQTIQHKLNTEFGHYEDARRHATGMLQAIDSGVVQRETINECAEKLMVNTPGYWLAPCLVSLAAWIQNDKVLAERALRSAIDRNDEKTSLFFAIIARRAGRYEACITWLERFFANQDPREMSQELIVVLDGFAMGLFGGDLSNMCMNRIRSWVNELSMESDYAANQRNAWISSMRSKTPLKSYNYPNLQNISPTWDSLKKSLNNAYLYQELYNHFDGILNAPQAEVRSIQEKVDNILYGMVKNYDEVEYPLRRQELMCKLIIECNGDVTEAKKRFDFEKTTLDNKISFTQLLSNAAMASGNINVSIATQKLALALSKEWIEQAFKDVVAQNTMEIPSVVDLNIAVDNALVWRAQTNNGENQQMLVASLNSTFDQARDRQMAAVKIETTWWVCLVIGILVTLFGLSVHWFVTLIGLGLSALIYVGYSKMQKSKDQIKQFYDSRKVSANNLLLAAISEIVTLRREINTEAGKIQKVSEIISTIDPKQMVEKTDKHRAQ